MRRLLAVLALFLVSLSSCNTAPWRVQPPPWEASCLTGAADARVVLRDGAEVVVAAPVIVDSERGPVLRGTVDGGEWSLQLAEVAQLETRHTEILPVIVDVVVVAVVVAGVVAIACCSRGSCGGSPFSGLSIGFPCGDREDKAHKQQVARAPILPPEHAVSVRARQSR